MTDTHERPRGMKVLDPRVFVLETRRHVMATKTGHSEDVRANGIDIHYAEAGTGVPLVLLNNSMVSTNPIWDALPFAYNGFVPALAEHFRVIVPDTRGSGKTVHPGGPITHPILADDVVALIGALELDRPLICGFSDGAETATLVGIRNPGSVRAIVNHGGFDMFLPDDRWAGVEAMCRQMLGGSPDALKADPDESSRLNPGIGMMFDLMKQDHDGAQGADHWRTVLDLTFDRITQRHGYTFDDLAAIDVPTLILIGDRDPFCTVEQGAIAYAKLPRGEMAVLPNTDHPITRGAIDGIVDFFERVAEAA